MLLPLLFVIIPLILIYLLRLKPTILVVLIPCTIMILYNIQTIVQLNTCIISNNDLRFFN